jgi:hypothetical protein
MSPISASITKAVNSPTPGSVRSTLTRRSALAWACSSPSSRPVSGARPSMTARQWVTISRDEGGRPGSASQPRPGPDPVAGGPVVAVVGGDRVDPVGQLGAEADQAGPVPQQRAELADPRRGDPRLGQQVCAQQLRQDRGVDLVVLQPRGGDRLAPQRVHQVRIEAVVFRQIGQPAPAERGRAGGFRNSRPESAGLPGCQGVAAKCSASSAATWSAACSGSQCEAPWSSVKR